MIKLLDNKLDNIFNKILDNFYDFIRKRKIIDKINQDENFVTFQNLIIDTIKNFNEYSQKENINYFNSIFETKKEKNKESTNDQYKFFNDFIIKYYAYYIFFSVAYFYQSGRDLYTTNIIEISKNQKNNVFKIENFFNSENNSKIVSVFNIIKNFQNVNKLANNIEKIKIILKNNPIKFESTINFFEKVGEDYISKNILIKDNAHNLIKALIINELFFEEKDEFIKKLSDNKEILSKYKFIDVVRSKDTKLIDFILLQKYLTIKQINSGLATEIYSFLEEMKIKKDLDVKTNKQIVNFLFNNKILIPITEEFLRYHKDTEKYTYQNMIDDPTNVISQKEDTKVKLLLNKLEKIKNLHSKFNNKNDKVKNDTEKIFFQQMIDRLIVTYNDNEELKIIQKLEDSEKNSDIDMLNELENFRNYMYINFRDLSKDGFNFRPSETVKCIRYTNILYKNKNPSNKLEYRIGNDSVDINIVGVAWNPNNISLNNFTKNDLIDVNNIMNNDNGIKSFESIITETFNNPKDKLFYWLFNNENDKLDMKEYVNVDSIEDSKKIMINIKKIFYLYSNLLEEKIKNEVKNYSDLSIYDINNIINYYSYKFFDFNFEDKISQNIFNYGYTNKIEDKKIIPDETDSFIPGVGKDKIILPEVTNDEIENYTSLLKRKNTILVTERVEEDISLEEEKERPVCFHHYKVKELARLSKSKVDDFNQIVFNFVKQYVKTNDKNDYVCKSCEEHLNLSRYQTTGTYVPELDVFLTTSLGVNEDLWKIPKYSKFTRGIRNIEKNLEKICFSINLSAYLGGTPIERLRRRTVIKDILDMIIIHTEYLKEQPKNRIEIATKEYGLSISNLFFFKFEDDIFLTSSKDTDKFKKIKYNNVLAYMILIIISELNVGQIMSLKTDKRCNFLIYSNIKNNLFSNIKILLGEGNKKSILEYPILCYILYYFSCVFTSNYFWLWDYENDKGFNSTIQFTIINTVVDLFNTIIEANYSLKDKSFQYEIIVNRILDKLNKLYKDDDLMKSIESQFNSKIKIDKDTKKISFVTKKIKMINIDNRISVKENDQLINNKDLETKLIKISQICDSTINQLPIMDNQEKEKYEIPHFITNCEDGKFHNWSYVKEGENRFNKIDLVCSKCKKKYSEISKLLNGNSNSISKEIVNQYEKVLKQIKINKLSNLVKEHCLDGSNHEFESEGNKCSKCKINPDTYNYSIKDYFTLEENLKKLNDTRINIMIEESKKIEAKIKQDFDKRRQILEKFKQRFEGHTKSNIIKYVNDFSQRLKSILGKSIKLGSSEIYIDSTYYVIDHDNYGNQIKNKLIIFDKDNKIFYEENNKHFNKDIYYYKDNKKNMKIYYDAINLNYLGYSDSGSSKVTEIKTYSKLTIVSSIKDKILNIGLPDYYFNLNLLNKEVNSEKSIDTTKIKDIMTSIITFRSQNIREIINKFIRTLYSVKFRKKDVSIYAQKEVKIVNESINNIKKFETKDENNSKSVFKHWKYIMNYPMDKLITNDDNYNFNKNLGFDFINSDVLFPLNNLDSKLLFFLIYNLNRLLDYNNNSQQINQNLAFMIIKLINYNFDFYRIPFDNIALRKFYKIVNINAPNIDESLRVVGSYEELLNSQEIDDENKGLVKKEDSEKTDEEKNKEIDIKEENEALDIDDYENLDDEDGYGEEETGHMDFL